MKSLMKLVVLLAVLAFCVPAQGEILVYSKLYNCWEAWEGLGWNVEEWTQKGFLVLDVDFQNGEPNEILQADQIEFEKDGRDKVYWQIEEEFVIERIEVDDEVIWVLEQMDGDEFFAVILMVKGKAKDMNIGLGRGAQREVARTLTGYMLYLNLGMGVDKEMCTYSLRLHSRFTKLANDPEEGNQDFDFARVNIVKAWLTNRGYEEVI
jgi:hypothetical protein